MQSNLKYLQPWVKKNPQRDLVRPKLRLFGKIDHFNSIWLFTYHKTPSGWLFFHKRTWLSSHHYMPGQSQHLITSLAIKWQYWSTRLHLVVDYKFYSGPFKVKAIASLYRVFGEWTYLVYENPKKSQGSSKTTISPLNHKKEKFSSRAIRQSHL